MSFKSFPPVFDASCRVLILGSFPSVKSREVNFYYGNRQNRFWGLFQEVFGLDCDVSSVQKAKFLLERKIAMWDVAEECEIKGSADNSLVCLAPNRVDRLIKNSNIEKIFCNGTTAFKLLNTHFPEIGIPVVLLPSTSPANVRFDRRLWIEVLYQLKPISEKV